MKRREHKVLKATREEIKLVEDLTHRSLSERLDAGEVEIVSYYNWSNVPELSEIEWKRLKRRMLDRKRKH